MSNVRVGDVAIEHPAEPAENPRAPGRKAAARSAVKLGVGGAQARVKDVDDGPAAIASAVVVLAVEQRRPLVDAVDAPLRRDCQRRGGFAQ